MDSVNLDTNIIEYHCHTVDFIPALQPSLTLLCDDHKASI